MKNKGNELTDKELALLEKKISKLYKQAQKELNQTIKAYFDQFKEKDEEKKKELENGEITKEEYKQWRMQTITGSNEYRILRDKIAERYLKVNKEAMEMVNDTTPEILSINHNYEAYYMENAVNE